MRRVYHIAAVIVALLSVVEAVAQSSHTDKRVKLADPFILLDNGTYYAYGTHGNKGIEYYTSTNLKEWKFGGLALHKDDSYGNKWFWAPEVYLVDGVYYMFYSAEQRTCVAISDSPAGPFEQLDHRPLIDGYKNIDNTLFIDDNGTPYMFYVRVERPFKICVAELNKDLQSIKKECVAVCISPTQSWERKSQRVNEGPSVFKHNGRYFMLYSGNGYKSHYYGIGLATAKSIKGPWRKSSLNPILQLPGNLVGAGHGAPFYDKKGRMHYVFHAHNSYEKIHPRCMYIARMSVKKDKVTISNKYFTPKVIE